jgi:hypothetical protein
MTALLDVQELQAAHKRKRQQAVDAPLRDVRGAIRPLR